MTDTIREHDPAECHDGDGCKPCQIVENRRTLDRLARATTVHPGARTRALQVLAEQAEKAKRAITGAGPVLAMLLLACALLVGCTAPEAIEQARTEAAACHGLAVEPSNPPDVRRFAARQSIAWERQAEALDGPVPGREAWAPIPAEFLPPR